MPQINLTKSLKILLGFVGMLFVFNIFLNQMGNKSSSLVSKLSIRNIRTHSTIQNRTSKLAWTVAPLVHFKANFSKDLTTVSVDSLYVTDKSDQITNFRNDVVNYEPNKNKLNSALQLKDPLNLPICRDPDLETAGPITPNISLETLDVVEAELGPLLHPGGEFRPPDCTSKHHVAIVVPFRDRYAHLSVFLKNLHPFLMKQHITYRIFVIEQTNGKPFNRAALMNIGFLEALKIYPWDCFVFHDVDLLPLDDRNLYNCPRQPRHMSVSIDTLNFKLPYRTIFGGVSAMTRKHFQTVNGFSNSYFGWGGEDDDMSNRLRRANLFISRYPVNIARYMMLKHQKEKANPKRYETLINGISKMELDGLNSIKYKIYTIKENPTFTWYLAELKISDQKS